MPDPFIRFMRKGSDDIEAQMYPVLPLRVLLYPVRKYIELLHCRVISASGKGHPYFFSTILDPHHSPCTHPTNVPTSDTYSYDSSRSRLDA